MKISRLYANKPDVFAPIDFASGLNVVLAEIRLPENQIKGAHSLGKTTLGRLLNFCFLGKRDKTFFLFKHFDLFKDFVFFLEVELADTAFVTIRREVEHATKISFKKHKTSHQDLTALPLSAWDHVDLPFECARDLLDSLLDWRDIKPWSFRHSLGYLLRTQNDFQDVFRLGKFAGPHSEWKPFLAHILGFNAKLISDYYERKENLEEEKKKELTVKKELGKSVDDISHIGGLLLLKQQEVEKKQRQLDAFDFRAHDKEQTKQLVDRIDERIATLNAERYSLNKNRKTIRESLQEERILFNPDKAQQLFEEAGVFFQGQIKKDYQQLIDFNRAITEERRGYLQEDLGEIEVRLKLVNAELDSLGKQRSDMLSFLRSTDIFNKYKQVANETVTIKADIASLERQRESLYQLKEFRARIRVMEQECELLQSQIENDVDREDNDKSSLFSSIRSFFSEIVEEVIDRKALLSVSTNKLGHLEFKVDILDELGNTTSADMGHTYRKLLCIAFDMAVLRARQHVGKGHPRFIFHDGIFESLDDRKKENLLAVIRKYAASGLQPIITLISTDLPVRERGGPVFDDPEIVLLLHDEDERGRLFKMATW